MYVTFAIWYFARRAKETRGGGTKRVNTILYVHAQVSSKNSPIRSSPGRKLRLFRRCWTCVFQMLLRSRWSPPGEFISRVNIENCCCCAALNKKRASFRFTNARSYYAGAGNIGAEITREIGGCVNWVSIAQGPSNRYLFMQKYDKCAFLIGDGKPGIRLA